MSRLMPALLLACLAACSLPDGGLVIRSPLLDVEVSPPAPAVPADACVFEGRVVLPPGTSCGGAALPPAEPTASLDGAGAPSSGGFAGPAEAGPPDLAQIIRAEENPDGGNVAYCDQAGLHIGDGIRLALSDAEREAALCAALDAARAEARRVLGEETWGALAQPRRDSWIELCYWAPCAEFVRAAQAMRAGDYAAAASEIEDSLLPAVDAARAARIARWTRLGRRG